MKAKWEWIKLILLTLTVAFVAYFIITVYLWSDELKNYFFFTGEWQNYILLTVLVFVALYLIKWLLKWEAKAFFPKRGA